jgi:CubicO group peptidase (beta-lactamase class C family)
MKVKEVSLKLVAVLALLCPPVALDQQAPSTAPDPLRDLAPHVERVMRDWSVPGLSVAVIKDDKIVFIKGFGLRESGKPGAVNERTLFAIGSATKAFTVASVALLADEGKLKLDDPVVKHLPGFQLYDPHLTQEVTLRDLLSHRTGLPRANISLLIPYDRAETVRRMRFLKPVAGLRSRFTYQNQMYLAAGLAVERLSGLNWDEFVRKRIFDPLGMKASNTSIGSLKGQENVATPHAKIQGAISTLPYRSIDSYAPAGAVNSNAFEMAQWVRLQLGGGTFEGKQLLSPALFRQTHALHTPIPVSPLTEKLFPTTHFQGYGMGWFLRDYRGRKVVEHGGNVDGMSAQIGMIPEEKLGIVILTNRDNSPLPEALMYYVFDAYLGGAGVDLNAEYLKVVAEGEKQKAAQLKAFAEKRTANTKPSAALEKYAGTFSNDLYGDAQVSHEGGRLRLRFGPGVEGELEHWQDDTFLIVWGNPLFVEAVGKTPVTFTVDKGGAVNEMKAQGLADYKRSVSSAGA